MLREKILIIKLEEGCMIHLETDRLILRDYCADDFDEYFRLMSDDKTMYYLPELKQNDIDAAKDNFAEVLKDMEREKQLSSSSKLCFTEVMLDPSTALRI